MKDFRKLKRGMTLVEILIATLILALVIVSIYEIFSKVMRSTDVGAWKVNTQQKLRVSMKNLFQDLSNATYPTWIEPNKTEIDDSDKYKIHYKKDEFNPWDLSVDDEILSFYICTPGKRKFPSDMNRGRNIVKVSLVIDKYEDGRPKIMYVRKIIEDNGIKDGKTGMEQMKEYSKILFEDVNKIKFSAEKFVDESVADPSNREKLRFSVEIRASHPKYPKITLVLKQNIILNVKAKGM